MVGSIRSKAKPRQHVTLLRRAAWPFWYYFALRNLFREGEASFRGAIEALQGRTQTLDQAAAEPPGDAGSPAGDILLAYLKALCALFVLGQLRVEEAQALLRESLACLRCRLDVEALADSLRIYGQACWFAGAFEEGLRCYVEAYDLARKEHCEWLLGIIPVFAGLLEHDRGHYAESCRWFTEGLAASRRLGDSRLIASTASGLGRTDLALGHVAEAESLLCEALELARRSGDRFIEGAANEQLATLRQAAGHLSEARSFFDESLALYREVDDRSSLARALVAAGYCALQSADESGAQAFFVEALQVASQTHLYPSALDALVGIATLRVRHRIDHGTLAMLCLVLKHPASTHDAHARAQRLSAGALPGLPAGLIDEAEAAGRPEQFDAIVTQALS